MKLQQIKGNSTVNESKAYEAYNYLPYQVLGGGIDRFTDYYRGYSHTKKSFYGFNFVENRLYDMIDTFSNNSNSLLFSTLYSFVMLST